MIPHFMPDDVSSHKSSKEVSPLLYHTSGNWGTLRLCKLLFFVDETKQFKEERVNLRLWLEDTGNHHREVMYVGHEAATCIASSQEAE